MNLSRLESLVGIENIEKIRKLNVLVLGLGGVGGYAVETLIRCGVERITLVDGDTIKPSNINRQIIATSKNNNKYKTKEWKKRITLWVSPGCAASRPPATRNRSRCPCPCAGSRRDRAGSRS